MTTILVAGDFVPIERIQSLLDKELYEDVFSDVQPFIGETDFSVVNLEAPIANRNASPITKVGRNLQSSESVIGALKYVGFKCVTLANNHFYDYGEDGALNTMTLLKKNGIDYIGAGKDEEAAGKAFYAKIGNETVAIINCCEHEYSIAGKNHAGSNPLHPISLYYSIRDAKENADYVLLIVHGGIEHYQLPTSRMQQTYRYAIDCGADAVINHHQHCYSGYEIYKDRPIFYGLGNFCFDKKSKRDNNWNEGYMVNLKFSKEGVFYEMIPYIQCNHEAKVKVMDKKQENQFYERIMQLNSIIEDPKELETNFNVFVGKTRKYFDPIIPYTGRWLKTLYRRGFLPTLIPKRKLLEIQNKMRCESHLERLLYIIDLRINK